MTKRKLTVPTSDKDGNLGNRQYGLGISQSDGKVYAQMPEDSVGPKQLPSNSDGIAKLASELAQGLQMTIDDGTGRITVSEKQIGEIPDGVRVYGSGVGLQKPAQSEYQE